MSASPAKPPNAAAQRVEGFLLTRDWRDTDDGVELELWAASNQGPLRIIVTGQDAVCFLPRDVAVPSDMVDDISVRFERRPVELTSPDGRPVDALYVHGQRALQSVRERAIARGMALFEADLKPTDRYLMERFITGGIELEGRPVIRPGYREFRNPRLRASHHQPTLSVVSLDIETSDLEGQLYSIALSSERDERVLMVGDSSPPSGDLTIEYYPTEVDVLQALFDWMHRFDPDIIIGWNVIGFDLHFLNQRCQSLGLTFSLGRNKRRANIHLPRGPNQVPLAVVGGRAVLDGIECLRAAFWTFEDYSLQAVSESLLGIGKTIVDHNRVDEIRRLYAEDPVGLARYNLQDCRLVREIFDATDLLHFYVERSQLTGLALGRIGGSVSAFDNLYLPRLHRRGFVAPDTGTVQLAGTSPGGYVLDSSPGIYRNVLLLDFKSLYPSIIRSFLIDPCGMWAPGDDPVSGFGGATFARDGALLPSIVSDLGARRDQAKREQNQPLSQAIKIIMNSFYGVLGASGCRFVDPKLTSSITRRGHEVIQRSQTFIEDSGYRVIYGDTDSLFVLLPDDLDEPAAIEKGNTLAEALNQWWKQTLALEYRVESHLELEFEHLFLRFLMPTVRGTDVGTKKRYAGMVRKNDGFELIFKGLEVVRTDWTEIARTFQRELYRRVFENLPYEDYVQEIDQRLLNGEFDEQLVYRKRLRRPIAEYAGTGPPHVQAARKLDQPTRWVRYVITATGPEPVEHGPHRPDYEHYRQRQLAPVADAILHFLGTSYDSLTSSQLEIF